MELTNVPRDAETQELIEELLEIRESIDNIDAALVHLLAERFKFTQKVGRLKAAGGLPASDPERERVQINRLRTLAGESHLDPAFAEKFLNFIVAEVIHHHEEIANSSNGTDSADSAATAAAPAAPATPAAPAAPAN
jgi:chorismate mutase